MYGIQVHMRYAYVAVQPVDPRPRRSCLHVRPARAARVVDVPPRPAGTAFSLIYYMYRVKGAKPGMSGPVFLKNAESPDCEADVYY